MKYKVFIKIKRILTALGILVYSLITLFFIGTSVDAFIRSFQNVNETRSLVSNLNQYSGIFGITITLITVVFVLNQIELAVAANKNSLRIKWKEKLDQSLSIASIDSIKIHFIGSSDEIFNTLYQFNSSTLNIKSKRQLEYFFELFIKDKITDFEAFSPDFITNRGLYPTRDTAYSLPDVLIILRDILLPSHNYKTVAADFAELYYQRIEQWVNANNP